jgi:hypothetical protein
VPDYIEQYLKKIQWIHTLLETAKKIDWLCNQIGGVPDPHESLMGKSVQPELQS